MDPIVSLNLTVHNQEPLLREVLDRLAHFTRGPYELVIVLDGCKDRSEVICAEFIRDHPRLKIKLLQAPNVFETKANNLAAQQSEGEHIVIVQDDMLIAEDGWNQRLIKPLLRWDDIFAVTSRTAHDWVANPATRDLHRSLDSYRDEEVEWCDILNHVNHRTRVNTPRDVFIIKDTVNRGPLAIRHADFRRLGYFDEGFAPQDMDDHDLCYRARRQLGKRAGLYWINFICKDDWGATRRQGRPVWLYRAHQANMRRVWERHRQLIESPKDEEIRDLR